MKTIGIFKTDCPGGWTRLSAWDGKFLQGDSTYGATGGTETHTHSINMPSQANFANLIPYNPGNQNYGAENFAHHNHQHTIDPPAANTSSENHLPEYINVVFCYLED